MTKIRSEISSIGAPRTEHSARDGPLPKHIQTQKNPGDSSGEATPVPIPNTEVKLSSAEDTERAAFRENRSSPGFLRVCDHDPGVRRICAMAARTQLRWTMLGA